MAPPADSIKEIVKQLDAKLAALRPLVEEYEKLQAARAVLVGDGTPAPAMRPPRGATSSSRASRGAPRSRAPRGANRTAILGYVSRHPGARAIEIAEATGIARATMQTTLYQLKRKGDLVPDGDGVSLPARGASRPARRASAGRTATSRGRGRR